MMKNLSYVLLFLFCATCFGADKPWKIDQIKNLGCDKVSGLNIKEYRLSHDDNNVDILFSIDKKFPVPSLILAESKVPGAYKVVCKDICSATGFSTSSISLKETVESFISFGFLNVIEKNDKQKILHPFHEFNYDNCQLECTEAEAATSCIYKMIDFSKKIPGVMHILFLFAKKSTTNCEIPIVSLNPGNNVVVTISYSKLNSSIEHSKFGVEFFYGSNEMPKDGFEEKQAEIWNDEFNPGSFTSYTYKNAKEQFIFFPNITYYSPTPIMQKSSVIKISKQASMVKGDVAMFINSIALSVDYDMKKYRKVEMVFGGEDAQPYDDYKLASVTFKLGRGKFVGSNFSIGTRMWLIIVMGFMGVLILSGPALIIYMKIRQRREANDDASQNLIQDDDE